MAYLTVEEFSNFIAGQIRARFPDVRMDIVLREYPGMPELHVFIGEVHRYREVDDFCRELQLRRVDPPIPFKILVKTWTGPWPGGQSIEQLRKQQKEFLKRVKRSSVR